MKSLEPAALLGFTYWAKSLTGNSTYRSERSSSNCSTGGYADVQGRQRYLSCASCGHWISATGVESTQYVAAKRLADVLVAQVREVGGPQAVLSQLV